MREMKDSGIEWIGKIPKEWDIGKILYALSMPITDGPHETPELYDNGIPFLSAEAVKNGRLNFDLRRGNISQEFYALCCKKYIPQVNDIYMIKSGATTGNIAFVETDEVFQIWSPLAVFRVNDMMYFKFLYFYLQSDNMQKQIQLKWSYGTQQNIGMRVLEKLFCVFPSYLEQTAIANYLDYKCGKIDVTIQGEKQHIEKLKEYRQSVITEAVTKGLDPTVPMKDTGIEWIGKIPQEWATGKMLYALNMPITDGPHETPELHDEGIPFLSAEAVKNGKLDFNLRRGNISQEFYDICCKKYMPKINDIYMIKSGATTGNIAIVETDEIFQIWSPLAVFRAKDTMYFRFLYYYLQSDNMQKQIQLKWSYGTQQNIGMRVLEKLICVFPPLPEQTTIADYLDRKTAQIDSAIAKKETLIEKLTEYKKSLIYEAVTGKMEVY